VYNRGFGCYSDRYIQGTLRHNLHTALLLLIIWLSILVYLFLGCGVLRPLTQQIKNAETDRAIQQSYDNAVIYSQLHDLDDGESSWRGRRG
jgi:hypothetical protein